MGKRLRIPKLILKKAENELLDELMKAIADYE
jgi:hypothetical protein